MSLIDTYRRNIARKKEQKERLASDRVREMQKALFQSNKIAKSKSIIGKTKSSSILINKSREVERAEKAKIAIDKKIADIDSKIIAKDKEISREEKKLFREQEKLDKRKSFEELKRLEYTETKLRQFTDDINSHTNVQKELQNAIIDLQSIPERITVLFMASNPVGVGQLSLDVEARSIYEMIRKAEHRDSVKLETRWATRPLDILQAINELNPDVVHFSGHGTEQSELLLQDSEGNLKLISKESIVQTIMTTSDKIKLVFFNACFSDGQAEAVVEHVDAAIGMNTSISDQAAIAFSAQFYSALSFGHSIEKSFGQAKAALMLEGISEIDTPILCVKNGLDPKEMIIVRPQV